MKPRASSKKPRPDTLPPEVRPDQSVELLKALHILTRDGQLNQDSRRKLKQVYHLHRFIETLVDELREPDRPFTMADHGAGKSYLGFIVYDLCFKSQASGWIYGIETRPELVARSEQLAQTLGFDRMAFLNMTVEASKRAVQLPGQIDVVTALHACDTATDDAIAFGIEKKARAMVLVPCCQAEVSRALNADKSKSLTNNPLAELWRHPIHTREMGSQITNVVRCLYLQAMGYDVTVTELVGWEHSLKNELIIARFTGQRRRAAAQRLNALIDGLGLGAWARLRYPGFFPAGPAVADEVR